MASWLKERNNANELKKGILGENLNLDEAFLSVESINQCVELFHHYKLIGNNDLDIEKIDFLMNLCGRLRKKGLGLEPNIIGRAVAWIVLDRDLAGSVSIRFAKTDTDFHRLTIEADTARDRGDFADAQYFYWQALQLFPFHSNIRVQYAHSLKEQGLMAQALPEYIDAYYFGASKEHVEIYLDKETR